MERISVKSWLQYLHDKHDHQVDLNSLTLLLLNGNLTFSKNLGIISYKNNHAIISDTEILIDFEAENIYTTIYDFISKYDYQAYVKMLTK